MTDRADRFTVVLDANVLFGALGRNVLLSLAEAGFYRPRWSAEILDEFERTFAQRFRDPDTAQRHRTSMEHAFPEALVERYTDLIPAICLPDSADRHVVAAAVRTKASLIVTDNLRHFPAETLIDHELEAVSLDAFVADLLDLAGVEAVAAFRWMRQRFRNPAITAETLLRKMEEQGMVQAADHLQVYREIL